MRKHGEVVSGRRLPHGTGNLVRWSVDTDFPMVQSKVQQALGQSCEKRMYPTPELNQRERQVTQFQPAMAGHTLNDACVIMRQYRFGHQRASKLISGLLLNCQLRIRKCFQETHLPVYSIFPIPFHSNSDLDWSLSHLSHRLTDYRKNSNLLSVRLKRHKIRILKAQLYFHFEEWGIYWATQLSFVLELTSIPRY